MISRQLGPALIKASEKEKRFFISFAFPYAEEETETVLIFVPYIPTPGGGPAWITTGKYRDNLFYRKIIKEYKELDRDRKEVFRKKVQKGEYPIEFFSIKTNIFNKAAYAIIFPVCNVWSDLSKERAISFSQERFKERVRNSKLIPNFMLRFNDLSINKYLNIEFLQKKIKPLSYFFDFDRTLFLIPNFSKRPIHNFVKTINLYTEKYAIISSYLTDQYYT